MDAICMHFKFLIWLLAYLTCVVLPAGQGMPLSRSGIIVHINQVHALAFSYIVWIRASAK